MASKTDHYSATRALLWNQRTALLTGVQEDERNIGWHNDELMRLRTAASEKRAAAEQLKTAAEALGALDAAGIVMTTKTDAAA